MVPFPFVVWFISKMTRRLVVLFLVLGALFVDLSTQDCVTTKRTIEAIELRDSMEVPQRSGGRHFKFSDERDCEDDNEDG